MASERKAEEYTVESLSYPKNQSAALWLQMRLLFPPLILVDALKTIVEKPVSKLTFPAQYEKRFPYNDYTRQKQQAYKEVNNEVVESEYFLNLLNNTKLHAYVFKPKKQEINKPVVIRCTGNAQCIEDSLPELIKTASFTNCTTIGINFPGVGQSTGKVLNQDDLIATLVAHVEYQVNINKVDPKLIILDGNSIGAGAATIAAAHLHKNGMKVSLINDRSFTNLARVVEAQLRYSEKSLGDEEDAKRDWSFRLLSSGLKAALSLVNWVMDAGTAYKSIPSEYRYSIGSTKDSVIRGDSRLNTSFGGDDSNQIFSAKGQAEYLRADGALFAWNVDDKDSHTTSRSLLENSQGKTATDFVHEIIKNVGTKYKNEYNNTQKEQHKNTSATLTAVKTSTQEYDSVVNQGSSEKNEDLSSQTVSTLHIT